MAPSASDSFGKVLTAAALGATDIETGKNQLRSFLDAEAKKAERGESAVDQGVVLDAMIRTGAITQDFVDLSGGRDAIAGLGAQEFHTTLSLGQGIVGRARDKQERLNILRAGAEGSGVSLAPDADEADIVRATSAFTKTKEDQANAKEQADQVLASIRDLITTRLQDPNLTEAGLQEIGVELAGILANSESIVQNLTPNDRAVFKNTVDTLTEAAANRRPGLVVNDYANSVATDRGNLQNFGALSANEQTAALGTEAVKTALAPVRTGLALVPQISPEVLAAINPDDAQLVADFYSQLVGEDGTALFPTAEEMLRTDPTLAASMSTQDLDRITKAVSRARFVITDLAEKRRETQLMFDSLEPRLVKFMMPGGLPSVDELFTERQNNDGKWEIQTNEALFAQGMRDLREGNIDPEELEYFDANREAITSTYPAAQPFASGVTQLLTQNIRDGFSLPSSVVTNANQARTDFAASSIDQQVGHRVGAILSASLQPRDSSFFGRTTTDPAIESAATNVFVPEVFELTTPPLSELQAAQSEYEAATRAVNLGGTEYQQLTAMREQEVAAARLRSATVRSKAGRTVADISNAIAMDADNTFAELGGLLDSMAPKVGSGRLAVASTQFTTDLAEVAALPSESARRSRVAAIIDEAAPLIAATTLGDGASAEDVLAVRELVYEQFELMENTTLGTGFLPLLRDERTVTVQQKETFLERRARGTGYKSRTDTTRTGFDNIKPDEWTGDWRDQFKLLRELREDR